MKIMWVKEMFRCYEFCKFSDMHVLVAVTGEERWVCFTEQEEEVDSAENNEFFSTPFIFSLLSHLTSFSFFTTHGFIFTTSHHHRRSLPPLLSLPSSPLSTAGIQSPSHTTNPLHCKSDFFFFFFSFLIWWQHLWTAWFNRPSTSLFSIPFIITILCSSTNLQFGNPFSFFQSIFIFMLKILCFLL
jgi:hypothetical protein